MDFATLRKLMVERQLKARDITDPNVLRAMEKVPRHEFVPKELWHEAYEDHPLPIGYGQTISQPYIVAYMTQAIRPKKHYKVLEIGTGSGYQAAVLAELVSEVYTIEIIEPLAKRAEQTLKRLGYKNVHVKVGDGYYGWPEHAPFDAIIITAAPPYVPKTLLEQLKIGGILVAPVGETFQELKRYTRTKEGYVVEDLLPVRFVPMTGKVQEEKQ